MIKRFLVILFLSIALLWNCAPQIGYDFLLIKPDNNSHLLFSDSLINIQFSISQTWYKGVEGMEQYDNYEGISFVLQNKTGKVLTIDWNKISFKDYSGSSGNSVMHTGIKYTDCSSYKNPTILPPNETLKDIIIPCYALSLETNGWQVHMLPSPRQFPKAEFGIYIPIKINDDEYNYNFEFQAIRKELQ